MAMYRSARIRQARPRLVFSSSAQRQIEQALSQSLPSVKHQVCAVDDEHVYHHVTGLHGDQRDSISGELRGNQNGDFFWWRQTLLAMRKDGLRAFETWRNADVLENHDDDHVMGFIPDVYPIFAKKSIDMLMATSRAKAPKIVEALEKEDITDVSMGAIVGHSFCSVPGCKRHASLNDPNITEDDWCDHLRQLKGSYMHDKGIWVYEDNRDVFGVECSWITSGVGADSDAITQMKVANLVDRITNAQHSARVHPMTHSIVDLFHLQNLHKAG